MKAKDFTDEWLYHFMCKQDGRPVNEESKKRNEADRRFMRWQMVREVRGELNKITGRHYTLTAAFGEVADRLREEKIEDIADNTVRNSYRDEEKLRRSHHATQASWLLRLLK